MLSSFTAPLSRGHAALRGILAVGLGTTFAVWPGITIGTIIALFAIYTVVDAGVCLVRAFQHGVCGSDRALLGLRALIEVIAAGVAVFYPGATAAVMTVVIGIYAITLGGTELAVVGRLSKFNGNGWGWEIAGGVLSIMTGVALVVWPGIGAVTLAIVFGLYLAISGFMLLLAAAKTPSGRTVVA
ncbi:DUF308 domain-containing protein [Solirubrobacter ginsenosidimutans]|uniref:DUF308 domain-containing protein n=1 Tax=Solirubrobacter ginsenosidimutans TaxID=490573 RepID=A0A9X3RYC5_9ACTN|nr:DUF308 domain-containing protein [Solirubrobacter ginsenosidimutans]MDA0159510.1 DUF308 domain-containing protein [Solirubrobacter ginsenosidimutans]